MPAAPVVAAGLVPLVLLRWRINVLALGDEEARALGVEAGRLRVVVILCATLVTASVVAVAGVVGWVGLVIPHIARMIVGPGFGTLLPVAALLGAGYMLAVDTLARTISASGGAARHPDRGGGSAVLLVASGTGTPGMGVTIETQDLAIGYPGHEVGSDITLAAGAGAVLCLLGPNGSGKTTLFKTLLGLLPAQGGRVLLAGQPITQPLPGRNCPPCRLCAPGPRGALRVSRAGGRPDGPYRAARALRTAGRGRPQSRPRRPGPAAHRGSGRSPTTPGSPAASASSC